jgi:hypothetical protein
MKPFTPDKTESKIKLMIDVMIDTIPYIYACLEILNIL